MTKLSFENRSRLLLWLALLPAALVVGGLLGWMLRGQLADQEPGPAANLVTSTPAPSPTVPPECPAQTVEAGLETILVALQNEDLTLANDGLDGVLALYGALAGRALPACGALSHRVLGMQALVAASTAWGEALESGSVRQMEEAVRLVERAVGLAPAGPAQSLAEGLQAAAEQRQAVLAQLLNPGREITNPETLATETAGGLHPLCDVNTLAKPLLAEGSGEQLAQVSRMEIVSDTLFLLAQGEVMMAGLDHALGPSPAVFLAPAGPADGIVAGARVEELVDLTAADGGDLLLLEKSGRLLRRTAAGEWSLERPAQADEMPVAVAPYGGRAYLLDPAANQVWRFQAGATGYDPQYFAELVLRDVSAGADLAIDGAIYVARRDGRVRRYYVGVEDPAFRPDTDLGVPAAILMPDDPGSTLVYAVDGPGRRLLGLDRDTGAYRLGFNLNVEGVGWLTSGLIRGGRLYLTDGESLFITILAPTPAPAVDCPALPYLPVVPFDRPELGALGLGLPTSGPLPDGPALYPGGRWPQLGYGVLDGIAFVGLPVSETVRAIAPGTVSRIVLEPPLLLETELGVISTTGRVPAEYLDALWGRQVWIDHGNGVESRYGGLAAVLEGLAEGQSVRKLTIIGFAGEGPFFLGVWVDGQYLGYGRGVQETIAGYRRLFALQE